MSGEAESSPRWRCDFCMAIDPEDPMVLETAEIRIGDVVSDGKWSMCKDCAADLEKGDHLAMYSRWVHFTGHVYGDGQRAIVTMLWEMAWYHRKGMHLATAEDFILMQKNLEDFRKTHPEAS